MGKKMRFFCTIFTLLLLAFCAVAAGNGEIPGEREASSLLLDDRETVTYQNDGTSVRTDEYRVRILNDKGLREYRQVSLKFSENYEKIVLEKLEIKKPDGKTVTLDPALVSRVVTDDSSMGNRIFDPTGKELQVAVPQLAVGDEVLFRFCETEFKPRFPGNWCGISVLQGEFPIRRYEYLIDAPAEKPLKKIFVKNEVPGTLHFQEERKGDRILYRWTAENVPPVTPEPAMPALWRCSQRVSASTVDQWETVSRWYFDLCEKPIAAVTPAIKEKVAELTGKLSSREEKIKAIFQFVSHKINYTGLTEENVTPGYEPHPVSRTFERQNGVCRDKAALLVAMLREAGFDANMVLFMAGDVKDAEVPNFYFNHAIAAIETGKGEYQLLDPTDETTRDFLPAYERNCSYLVAKREGDTLRRSPSAKAEENCLTITGEGHWHEDWTLTNRITLDFTGLYDVIYRSFLAGVSQAEIDIFFSSKLRSVTPDAELLSLEITPKNPQDTSVPLHIVLEFRKHISPILLQTVPAPVPEFYRVFSLREKLVDFSLNHRRFPLKTRPFCVREHYTAVIPPGLQVTAVPAPLDFSLPGKMEAKRYFSTQKNTVTWGGLFSIQTDEFSPEEYRLIKDKFGVQQQTFNTRPLGKLDFSTVEENLKKDSFYGLDSVLLSDEKEIILGKEPGSWEEIHKVRRKLFTYAATSTHSTLSIPYFPDYDSVEITGETITSKGEWVPLSPTEIREMDAPDNGKTGQYPAHKIKVAVFSRVTPGCEISYILKIKRSRRNGFYTQMTVGGKEMVLKRLMQLRFPNNRQIHYASDSLYFFPKWERLQNEILLSLELSLLPPGTLELNQTPFDDFLPACRISDFDYSTYGKMLEGNLREKMGQDPEEIRALAEKVTASCKSDREKAIAIRNFVSRSISAAGPALNDMPAEHFHTPKETLAFGSANSADRAILLAALCEAAELPCRFIAVSDEPAVNSKKEQLIRIPRNVFHSILVFLPSLKCYLNDTGNFAELGTLRHEGKISMDLQNASLTGLRTNLEFHNRERRAFSIFVQPSGHARIILKRILYGPKAENFRAFFSTANPLKKRQFAEQLCYSFSPGSVLHSFSADLKAYPVQFTLEYDVPHFAFKMGNYYTCTLPGFTDYGKEFSTTDQKRTTPYLRKNGWDLQQEYTLELPKGFIVLPQREKEKTIGDINTLFYREHFISKKENVFLKTRLTLLPCEISPDGYGIVNNLNSFFVDISSRTVLLYKGE